MTSAPATMAIGRSRIEALAASVSRACTCFACSGTADAHSAADDATSAALSTARCAVPVKRSTWDVALSAIRSVAWCAACATFSTLALAGVAPLPLPGRLLPKGVVRSMLVPFQKRHDRNAISASAVAFAVGLSVFHSDPAIRRSLISSLDFEGPENSAQYSAHERRQATGWMLAASYPAAHKRRFRGRALIVCGCNRAPLVDFARKVSDVDVLQTCIVYIERTP